MARGLKLVVLLAVLLVPAQAAWYDFFTNWLGVKDSGKRGPFKKSTNSTLMTNFSAVKVCSTAAAKARASLAQPLSKLVEDSCAHVAAAAREAKAKPREVDEAVDACELQGQDDVATSLDDSRAASQHHCMDAIVGKKPAAVRTALARFTKTEKEAITAAANATLQATVAASIAKFHPSPGGGGAKDQKAKLQRKFQVASDVAEEEEEVASGFGPRRDFAGLLLAAGAAAALAAAAFALVTWGVRRSRSSRSAAYIPADEFPAEFVE